MTVKPLTRIQKQRNKREAAFIAASESQLLLQHVPSVKEIPPADALKLWQATLAQHKHWTREESFMAGLAIALSLTKGNNKGMSVNGPDD